MTITADAEKGVAFAQGLMKKAPPKPRDLLWTSFWDLDTMRPWQVLNGMEKSQVLVGYIPLDKIRWYAEYELAMDRDDADAFVWIVRQTDAEFVHLKNSGSH